MRNLKVRATICKILVGIIAFVVVCPLSGPPIDGSAGVGAASYADKDDDTDADID